MELGVSRDVGVGEIILKFSDAQKEQIAHQRVTLRHPAKAASLPAQPMVITASTILWGDKFNWQSWAHFMVRSLTLAPMAVALTLGTAVAANDDAAPGSVAALPPVPGITGTLGAVDAVIAEWLRRLVENDLYQYVPRKEDRSSIEAFYRNRSFAPIWIRNGGPLPRVREATEFLRDISADGLDPSDYPRPYFVGRSYRLAADELILTNSVATFARHARIGRVGPARLGDQVQFEPLEPKPSDILGRLAEAADARAVLDTLLPQNPEYKALKAVLASERAGGSPRAGGTQSRIGQIDTLIANMERWRWLPRDFGAAYVIVNIPDYTLKVVDRGQTLWSTRMVVGKAGSSSTPLFSRIMTRIVINPGGRSVADHIRFDISNKLLVMQGDGPANLFAKNERVHGRSLMLENPEKYAQVLLSIARPEDGFTVESIRGLYGDREQSIPFKRPIPVHVSYQTAFVDDAGELQIRPDIYGYDRDISRVMLGDHRDPDGPLERNRAVADGPRKRNHGASSKPAVHQPTRPPFVFPWN